MKSVLYSGYYLVGLKSGSVVTWDGGHDNPVGVKKAMALYNHIGLSESGVEYGMVEVSKDIEMATGATVQTVLQELISSKQMQIKPVPKRGKISINKGAASICRQMVKAYKSHKDSN